MRYVHTNIISTDWQSLATFYQQVFGCKPIPPIRNHSGTWLDKGTGVSGASLVGIHLSLPGYEHNGPTLEIYTYLDTIQNDSIMPNTTGISHLAFEVNDVQSVLQDILKFGGSRLGKIASHAVSGVGNITFVYARDPDGNILEIQSWEK